MVTLDQFASLSIFADADLPARPTQVQTERSKLWRKAEACSDPVAAFALLKALGFKLAKHEAHLSPAKGSPAHAHFG